MGGLSWIEYLNDPSLVVSFQQFFGVRWPGKREEQNYSNVQSDRVLRSSARKSSDDPRRKISGADADFEFDAQSPLINENCDQLSTTATANTVTFRGKEKTHSRNESDSSSSGFSSGVEDDKIHESFRIDDVVQNKFWYYLFLFGTALGDEAFYACWFSFWFWNVDGAVGRRVVLLWGILMYVGQGLKDIIRWPRPACPPVVRLEKKWALEYGMPSTHAVVGAAVPFSTIIFTASRYQYPTELGVIGAIVWCSLVCSSRLYLGMHSVLDIIAGLSLVGVLFVPVIPFVDWLDHIILQSPFGGLALFLVGVVLCFCTPGGDRWSPARSDTFVILGSCVGLISGAWLNYQLGHISAHPGPLLEGGPIEPPYPVIWPSLSMLGLSLLRLVIGLCMVVASRAVIKSILYTFFHKLLKISKRPDLNFASNVEVFAELAQKYLTYIVIGLCVVYLSPAIFRLLGIERPTFHTEI